MASELTRAEQAGVAWHDIELFRAWADALRSGAAPSTVPAPAADTAGTALEALLRVEDVDAFARLLPVWQADDLDPRERHDRLARIYLRRGFLESAADEWIASASIEVDVRSMVGLAHVAIARGMPAEAREFAEEAVAVDPGDDDARALLTAITQRYRLAS
jgi:hypothetical protein